MRPIDKFILHVVHNLSPLFEYDQKQMDAIMNHYKEEADDLNIKITDQQLKKYIERFDQLKSKVIANGGTDLIKQIKKPTQITTPSGEVVTKLKNEYEFIGMPLSQLIKLATSSKGVEEPEEEADTTPDVVYNENGITIYNGSKEDNCLNFGRGESWCITRGSFGNYRYNDSRKNPTFYLVRDTNLPNSDRKSFFVVVVGNDNTYKASDRSNNDVGGRATEWDRWENWGFVEQNFPSVRGLQRIFKYIPLSSQEKLNNQFKYNTIPFKEWAKLPYKYKEQYLVIRQGNSSNLFSDISIDDFVSKFLPKYPQISTFIAKNAGIISIATLLKYLDTFSNQDVNSIFANMRDKINVKYLKSDLFSWDVKKLLLKKDKWDVGPYDRLYLTKDGNTIVDLQLGNDIKIDLYTEDEDYTNIKLNKRTSKYLLDYPELDKIPLRNLIKLAQNEVIDKELITKILDNAKKDSNSAIIIKNIDGKEMVLDSNTFASYEILPNGNIISVPFDDEDVQKIFDDSKDNESFQQNALNLFKTKRNIPNTIDIEALSNIINSIPYNKRIFQDDNGGGRPVVVLTSTNPNAPFFTIATNPVTPNLYLNSVHRYDRTGDISSFTSLSEDEVISILQYLRSINKSFDDNELLSIFRSNTITTTIKKVFARRNPPVNADNRYKIAVNGDNVFLINSQNPRESFALSTSRNNLKQANIPAATARQLLGQPQQAPGQAAAQANADIRARRGRPAGVPNAPRQPQPAAAEGDVSIAGIITQNGLTTGFNVLPRLIMRKFSMGGILQPTMNNRGASRRQNILGNAGRVIRAYSFGPSDIYIIRLLNNTTVASIVAQPGNSHWIVTNNNAYQLDSPADLLNVLRQRNLAEAHRYIVNEYFERNPKHLNEFKQLLRKHINEKKNEN